MQFQQKISSVSRSTDREATYSDGIFYSRPYNWLFVCRFKSQPKTHLYAAAIFSTRQHTCRARYMLSLVCLSVSLSQRWIRQKRLTLSSCNFHHSVAKSL